MSAISEVIEAPLTRDALAERYRQMCSDPRFANLPGKVELDVWGRILMSPASNVHGILQSRLVQRLQPLAGQALVEASVTTSIGLLVADVAWASATFMRDHGVETPFTVAPELCVEVASPSNSMKELREKIEAYLETGALEGWIVFPQSRRIEIYGKSGLLQLSAYVIALDGLFD